jgi:hypothetical protein
MAEPDQKPDQEKIPQPERTDVPVEGGEPGSAVEDTIEGVMEEVEEKEQS